MKIILGLLLAITTATSAMSQHAHSRHSNIAEGPASAILEPGQAAFAAIAEITQHLRGDAATDWSRVSIEDLRQHLIDMDLVTMRAGVVSQPTPDGAQFEITGDLRTRDAIQAMVPSHAPFLEAETGWTVVVAEIENGVSMEVSGDVTQILSLGFIGLMTIGAHHQEHHLLTARGMGGH